MAVSELVMPKLGLTMTEGVLAEWHVRPGDHVEPGQVMFVVETDKIANDIEAPSAGEIIELLVDTGETVPVGAPLARWTGKGTAATDGNGADSGVDGDGGEAVKTVAANPAATPAAQEDLSPSPLSLGPMAQQWQPSPTRRGGRAVPAAGSIRPAPEGASPSPSRTGRVIATPLARRMARRGAIDLSAVSGSGPKGRIKAADVEAALVKERQAPPIEPTPATGERIAVSARHMAMVRRVSAAQRDIPQFTVTARAEVSALLDLRAAMNAAGGPKITLNHLLLKAVGRSLLACPEANRIWADDALLAFPAPDVGMVVNVAGDLFVPVLRDAGRLPLDALALAAAGLIARAGAGTLQRADLEGGAVTVSNVGMAGRVESMAPMINPPQSSILGVGSVFATFRPDPEGRPTPARELVLTLACDHRVFDGMGAARFLDAIVQGLEAPHALLRTTDKDG
jgi:pyruvate dehydrogenase E2 component (dihydrolipoamide acetyltransferase)